MFKLLQVLALLLVGAVLIEAAGPYKVVGNKVLDSAGKQRRFLGVDRPSLEWSVFGERISQSDFYNMASWGANTVRIALNQDYWLVGATNYSGSYNATVLQAVQFAKYAGLTVILDLHWSDKGDLKTNKPDQQIMADTNSITFWKQVADVYKNDPEVLFELYNEPHDISWDVWLSGGYAGGFQVAGYQQLYDAVRSTGAQNVVIVGGLNWAYDLSGVASHQVQGVNIMYATHPYDFPGKQPSDWNAGFGYLAATYPVIATEFGSGDCSPTYVQNFVDYAQRLNIHWTAWAWYPGGCTFPALITDWNGTPSVPGEVIKKALQNQ